MKWGILGTANIVRVAFLPGLAAAGGVAAAVAGRDLGRTRRFAAENGIERAVAGYQRLIEDPGIDVIYIPLPNSLHAQWTLAALAAGKPVLCEKPLCGTLADAERVVAAARQSAAPLWEAFVFPFHDQFAEVRGLVGAGAIGELREIQSDFHFRLGPGENIRLSAAMQGGALLDVGCYPVRLACELFGAGPVRVQGTSERGGDAVDIETWGLLEFGGGRQLLLSCGMRRRQDTFTRLLGTQGQILISNPFHPRAADWFQVLADGTDGDRRPASAGDPPFAPALRHIHAVLRGEEPPRQLAADTSLPVARALHDLAAAGRAGWPESAVPGQGRQGPAPRTATG